MAHFFRRTFWTTGIASAILALGICANSGSRAALAFLDGVVVCLLMILGTTIAVRGTIRPKEERPKRWRLYGLLHVGKYGVAAGLLWAVAHWLPDQLITATIGYSLPLVIMILRGLALRRT